MKTTTKQTTGTLTARQEYQRRYYQEHKDNAKFRERRRRVANAYRSRADVKRKRNQSLKEKRARDPEYRARVNAYQRKRWALKKRQAAQAIAKQKSVYIPSKAIG